MTGSRIKLSVVVIVYDMREQAMNTLRSLAANYQRGIDAADYEVVVVENRSERNLREEEIAELPGNFRYFLRDEAGVSPAAAINFAANQCSGEMLGLLVDGARMLTPGIAELVLAAERMYEQPLVVVPAYHLFAKEALSEETRLETEQQWLRDNFWRKDGYSLFDNAGWSEGNKKGYFQPLMESNAVFLRRDAWFAADGADETFQLPGGGALILHIYKTLAMNPDSELVLLPGEGNFHQYHGGVTSSDSDNRSELIQTFREELDGHWDGHWRAVSREAVFLGKIGAKAQTMLERACLDGIKRFDRLREGEITPWPDQETLSLYHAEH